MPLSLLLSLSLSLSLSPSLSLLSLLPVLPEMRTSSIASSCHHDAWGQNTWTKPSEIMNQINPSSLRLFLSGVCHVERKVTNKKAGAREMGS
jgi:hypothetical protein